MTPTAGATSLVAGQRDVGPAVELPSAILRRSPEIEAAIATLEAELGTDERLGLRDEDAARRLIVQGRNEVEPPAPPTLFTLLVHAAMQPFVLLLLVAGVAAIFLGEARDGLLIVLGLVPIVGADVATEYRAERALAELRAAAAPRALVRRDGHTIEVDAAILVTGDIVLVRAGDVVPADIRLTSVAGLALDRSVLTGESVAELASVEVDATGGPVIGSHAIAFAGTSVVSGSGEGIVVATGPRTELGRIAGHLAGGSSRRSPLQRELDRLVRIMLVVAIGLIAVTMGAGVLRGHPAGANLLAGISAAIAAIPEEPPILLAVILGLGAHRLLRRKVLVRRLSAEETLGAVDLILTDKTGTLTENRLALAGILDLDGSVLDRARCRELTELALRSEDDAWRSRGGTGARGSFTRALTEQLAVLDVSPPHLHADDLVESSPPADGRPYSMTRARRERSFQRVILGAPEAVLGQCEGLAEAERDAWLARIDGEAGRGARLLLLAEAMDGEPLRAVAVLAFADPLRDDVRDALDTTRSAGIQTIVVTGDHPATAVAVARAAGLETLNVHTGRDLATWSDERLDAEIGSLHIVARALPDDKLRLVEAARRTGRTVAVTGDGVNDAPALTRADVAVAMGSGSAVAKGASDLVLGDDSFATLVYAIREGRRIVANVQKGLVFLISTHVALLGFIFLATILGYDQPLLPIQILWMELFIDLSASVAFEREPEEPQAMKERPRPRRVPLLTLPLLTQIALAGGFTALVAVGILAAGQATEHAKWLAYTALVVGQAVRAYANRSLTRPTWQLATNRFLLMACVTVVIIQAAIPAVPLLAEIFRASPLGVVDWLLVGAIALAPYALAETWRALRGSPWVA